MVHTAETSLIYISYPSTYLKYLNKYANTFECMTYLQIVVLCIIYIHFHLPEMDVNMSLTQMYCQILGLW